MKKTLGRMSRLGIALAIIAGAVFGSASAASAVTLPESAPLASSVSAAAPISAPAVRIVPAADGDGKDNNPIPQNVTLPMNRWSSATLTFDYQTDGNPVGAAARATERTVYYSLPMMTGNSMWVLSSFLLDGATQFKPMKLVGYKVDQAAAGIGDAIWKSPLISLAFVVIALGTIFALKRGERPWRRVWTTSLVAAMFFIMVIGSSSSTEEGGKYVPGVGSPGWFLTSISNTTETIMGGVASSLAPPDFSGDNTGTCSLYMGQMAKLADALPDDKKPSTIAKMASALWTQSGLKAWKLAQFGNTRIANKVYCHVLDWQYPEQAAKLATDTGLYPDKSNVDSAAFSPNSGEKRDRSAIAWAVCNWNGSSWTADKSWFTDDGSDLKWGKKDSGAGISGEKIDEYAKYCDEWWSKSSADWDSDHFRVGPNSNDTRDFVGGQTDPNTEKGEVYTFLTNWHGADNSGIAVTFSYNFSSLVVSLTFIVVAAAVFFVNIAIVAAMLSIFVVLIVVLFTKNDVESRLAGFVKNLIGLIVFSSVAALLIAMLTKITEVLSSVGSEIFKEVPIAIMVWNGLSPFLALVMLHFVFTKLLRVPSPFKLSSALAWGAAAGAAGGAVGAGVSNAVARGENRVENAIKSAPGAAGRKIKDAISSKGGNRDGAAAPAGTTKGSEKDQAAEDKTGKDSKTAVERRGERKAEKAELKEAKRDARGEKDKNEGYLSAMDRISGGNGELDPARTGWRGAANKVSGFLGKGDVLSNRDESKMGIASNLAADAGDKMVGGIKAAGRNVRSVPAKMWENAREKRAQYSELWANNKGAAIKQTLKTTAKYGALGVAGTLTGGGAVAAYAGYRTAKSGIVASRDVSRQNTKSALDALRQAKENRERQSQQQTSKPQPQPKPSRSGDPGASGNPGGGRPRPTA